MPDPSKPFYSFVLPGAGAGRVPAGADRGPGQPGGPVPLARFAQVVVGVGQDMIPLYAAQ